MPERSSYDYAVVRVVPSVERAEFVNVGIILFSKSRDVLAASIGLDEARLQAMAPTADVPSVRTHLDSIERICADGPGAGPIGKLSQSQRFQWLVSPRSTVIQTSPVHSGLCDDPHEELDRLFERLVEIRAD